MTQLHLICPNCRKIVDATKEVQRWVACSKACYEARNPAVAAANANKPLKLIKPKGEGRTKATLTDEARWKMGASRRGRTLTIEERAKISEQRKGVPQSEETKAKIRASLQRRFLGN